MHWEANKFVWLILLHIHFIAVVWNPNRNIFKIWLYWCLCIWRSSNIFQTLQTVFGRERPLSVAGMRQSLDRLWVTLAAGVTLGKDCRALAQWLLGSLMMKPAESFCSIFFSQLGDSQQKKFFTVLCWSREWGECRQNASYPILCGCSQFF